MVVLGLSSCDDKSLWSDDEGGMMIMYGSPYADYDVTVKVTDEAGKPINGISLREPWIVDGQPVYKTDHKGEVSAKIRSFSTTRLDLILEDIDGDENGGTFKTDTLRKPDFTITKVKNGDGWFAGEFKAYAEVKMKKEED